MDINITTEASLRNDHVVNQVPLNPQIFTMNQLLQMQIEVRSAIPILSDHCLYFSAKWYRIHIAKFLSIFINIITI